MTAREPVMPRSSVRREEFMVGWGKDTTVREGWGVGSKWGSAAIDEVLNSAVILIGEYANVLLNRVCG